jgi:predicted small lipoprotein YifL
VSSFSGAIRLAAICVLALALGLTLSACGRRGPLDAPPGVVNTPQGPVQLDSEGKPLAPPGEKKRIPLDVLLD